jgi:Methyltransferase domain
MDYLEQFRTIDQVLTQTRQYWQILPFQYLSLPWHNNSLLTQYLETLSITDIEKLDADDSLLRTTFAPYLNIALDCIEQLAPISAPISQCPDRFKTAIKGRKWAQIERFEALVPLGKNEVLEWCAGKGHLGRLISYHQQRTVTSVEWQQTLCQQGQQLSDNFGVDQSFIQADVLNPDNGTVALVKQEQQLVALHACGDLHVALLKQATLVRSKKLLIAPCCFHLIASQTYQPLSDAAQTSRLTLVKRDLNFSMQKTVVAGQREKQHREIEVAWRLGFDLLQRRLRGSDQYLPLPSIRQSMLTQSFGQFCQWACGKKNITLPKDSDLKTFEDAGWRRRLVNARIELVTHAFRQLLERWLLLDRVIYLQEHGYNVELLNFCQPEITPRNAIIIGSIGD